MLYWIQQNLRTCDPLQEKNHMANYLTVDVGGTNIKYAIMNDKGEILEKGEIPTPYEGLEVFIDTIVDLYNQFAEYNVEALAMSAPGKIDSANGYFYTSGALKYISGVNLRDRLAERIPVPFAVENDAKAAALAELWMGSMQGITNGSVVVLGTGIGGAIIINGKLYRGSTFAAGEYSCISSRLDLPYDREHNWANLNGVGHMVEAYEEMIGAEKGSLNGRILFTRANEGEPEALKAIEDYCVYLATAITSLQTILDVERVSIGGGISRQPILLDTLRRVITEMSAPFEGRVPYTLPDIQPCSFGNDANMIGALYHYLYELK
jgi:predicted NBD/HSP70 family sugar kinase